MSIPGAGSPLFLTSAAADAAAYQINRSLRFNDDDTAYLNRTPSSTGNRKTWTWSAWVKRGKISAEANLFSVGASSTDAAFRFNTNDTLQVRDGGGGELTTNAVFRDPSAWYHIVVALDNTQSTNTDRFKVYVNGVEQTYSAASYASQNTDGDFNTAVAHYIGRQVHNTSNLFDGYLAEVHWVDGGTQLAASDFGFYDSDNVWQPKDCKDDLTYGTNGFYLKFADNSSAAALGTDSSGNSNTFTVNNLTVVASADTSQTWSSSSTGYHSGAGSAFDGNLTTSSFATGGANANAYVDITAINASKVEVYISAYGSGSAGAYYYCRQTDGTQHTYTISSSGTSLGWITVYDGSQISINRLGGARNSSGAAGSAQYGWKVDGVLLVDSGTAGFDPSGNDSLIDTPTNYTADSGNNGGNYATLHPLHNGQTLSNGNLDVVGTSSWQRSVSTIAMSSGKWYWEYEITASNEHIVGVGPLDMQMSGNLGAGSPPGSGYGTETGYVNGTGANSSWSNTGGSTTGDVIGVAFDADAGNMYIYKNGTALNSGAASHTGLTNGPYYAVFSLNGSSRSGTVNFGQRPFKYTNAGTNRPAATYLSLCTTNLPDPTIADGSTAFDTTLYSGNDTQRDITGLGFSPDMVWIKKRSDNSNHSLMDTVRGATKNLVPNDTQGEGTETGYLNAFLSNGFSIGTSGVVNDGSSTYVAWAWDGGTSTVSNTDGSITSNVRANASAGFSIVSYTGDNNAGDTVGHGLSAKPGWILIKNRDVAFTWYVYHSTSGGTKYLRLDTTGSEQTGSGAFNNTEPTSSVFSLGQDNAVNDGNKDYIAYCWAPVDQYSAFGSYEGNGNADGPFVALSFRPAFVIVKNVDNYGGLYSWWMFDSTRDPSNPVNATVNADTDGDESSQGWLDILSNGFKIRASSSAVNLNAHTHIYAAFAEHPFKTARAR